MSVRATWTGSGRWVGSSGLGTGGQVWRTDCPAHATGKRADASSARADEAKSEAVPAAVPAASAQVSPAIMSDQRCMRLSVRIQLQLGAIFFPRREPAVPVRVKTA
jgi:hypothetical protein